MIKPLYLFLASFLSIASRLSGSFPRFTAGSRRLNPSSQRTDADVKEFLKSHFYRGATNAQVDLIADSYSQDPVAVSSYLL